MNKKISELLRKAFLHTYKMEIHEVQDCLAKAILLLEKKNEKRN